MDGLLGKLTSQYTWKPLRAALTATSLNFCRPNDDILIDSIPLHEIIDIKKRSDFPGVSNGAPDLCLRNVAAFFEEQSSDQLHIIQIQTVEGGRNSGRTYYLNADTAPKCKEWMHATQAAADLADLRHLAGPRCFRRARRALRRLYQHPTTQTLTGVLIVLNFAANIAQAELQLPPGSPELQAADAAFAALEVSPPPLPSDRARTARSISAANSDFGYALAKSL
jgi:hypothetical protein